MKEVTIMTRYHEILRLSSLGFSNRSIALSVPCSRNTVTKVLILEGLFYPKQSVRSQKRMSDYDYIHKELLRNGVSKKLLWTEYMEECRVNGDERSCILNSAIIFSSMSRNDVLPCTSIANPVSRLKSTGQGILQQSSTRIPVKS